VHARVEDRIRTGNDTGIGRFPSQSYAINSAWLAASLLAATLLAWFAQLALDGPLAKAEPNTIRYRLLHVAALPHPILQARPANPQILRQLKQRFVALTRQLDRAAPELWRVWCRHAGHPS